MAKLNKINTDKFNERWKNHIALNPEDDNEEKRFQSYLVYASAWSDCMLFLKQTKKSTDDCKSSVSKTVG